MYQPTAAAQMESFGPNPSNSDARYAEPVTAGRRQRQVGKTRKRA
jgi:hypothetical protein